MKIPNRIYTTIIKARMNRVAKGRALSCKRNLSKTVSTTSRNSSANRKEQKSAVNRLMTNVLGQENITNEERLAENRAQQFLYSRMESAAGWVMSNAQKLLETGGDSIFANSDNEEAKETAVAEVKNFVNNYNIMMGRLNSSGEAADTVYAKKLQGYMKGNSKVLGKIGITAGDNGILRLDEKKLKGAEFEDIKSIFHGKDSLAEKVCEQAKLVKKMAEKKIETLKKNSYAISSNYTRYGKSESGYGESSYSFKA